MTKVIEFIEFVETYIHKKYLKSKHKHLQVKLSQFKTIKAMGFSLFSDINIQNIRRLDESLRNKNYRNSYVKTLHNALSHYINYAVEEGRLQSNPYHFVKLKKVKEIRVVKYIEMSEYTKIVNCVILNPVLAYARDLFVFQMNTGLAYVDLVSLKKMQISDGWIMGNREKTKVEFFIPLTDAAKHLIDKYSIVGHIHRRLSKKDNDHLFVFISLPYYNLLLKRVAKCAGVVDVLTTHKARHTFATLMLEAGMTIESISKMMGHRRVVMTELYSKVTMNKIKKEFDKIFSK